jgi:poly-gamma-glutamate synthesis protein (capsule biosynthesis protein)
VQKIIYTLWCLLIGAALAACAATGLPAATELVPDVADTKQTEVAADPGAEPAPPWSEATIAAVGDILIHNTVYQAAYDTERGIYDFAPQFAYVAPALSAADFTVANLETSLGGPGKPYSGYPQFNTPDSIVRALRTAGVDALTAANNHRMDTGVAGYYRTLDKVRMGGLAVFGARRTGDLPYLLREVNGIKIAFINFSYGGYAGGGAMSVNGLILPAEMSELMNIFVPGDGAQQAAASITAVMRKAEAAGAEALLLFLHWGNEYQRVPDGFQTELAELLAAAGATAIIGGHPHVLQPAALLEGRGGNIVPVFYSLGNFLSNQRLETVDDIYTEQGLIAQITLRRDTASGRVTVSACGYEPTWMLKRQQNGYFYEIIPSRLTLTEPESFPEMSANDFERARFGYDYTASIMAALQDLSPSS